MALVTMVPPSPAPRRSRQTWRWVLLVAASMIIVFVLLAATYPLWAASWIRGELEERLSRRLGEQVHIEGVELEYGQVAVEGIVVGAAAEPLIRLDRTLVTLDPSLLSGLRVRVVDLTVDGGAIEGTRARLTTLLANALGHRGPDDGGQARVQVVPERLLVRGVTVRVLAPAPGVASVSGVLELRGAPREKTAEVAMTKVHADSVDGRQLHAQKVSLAISARRDEDGAVAVDFPLIARIDDLGATISPQIALAGVDGTFTLLDSGLTEIAVDVEGGFSDTVAHDDGPTGQGKLWSVKGKVRRDLSTGELNVEMAPFRLDRIPEVLARLPLVESEAATVGGTVRLAFAHGKASIRGDVVVEGLNVGHPLLAAEVVRDVGFELALDASIDPQQHAVTINRAALSRGKVTLELAGDVVHTPDPSGRRYALRLRAPVVPCQEVLDALPRQLVPSLQGFALSGNFDMDVVVRVDMSNLEELELGGSVGIWACSVQDAPPQVSAVRLGGPFVHRVTMRDGSERIVRLFPGSGTFTPITAISPHVIAAVLTTEDGGFYRHRGFLPSQFTEALRRNLAAGRVRLGASTVTMQMVKNVLLSHERTLARKLQELFLTWYVERSLTKDRIMEIYLNVVEYAPGVYGITRAAEHYFGKHPRDLNPLESAYLALMLPSPVRRHESYCLGAPTPRTNAKLRRVLAFMHSRNRLSAEDHETWKDADLVFDGRERTSTEDCLAEMHRLLEAAGGQRSLTGLLSPHDPLADLDVQLAADSSRPSSLEDTDWADPWEPAEGNARGVPAMDDEGGPMGGPE